jgi:hypothetical protein
MDVHKVWRELCDDGRVGFSSSVCVCMCVFQSVTDTSCLQLGFRSCIFAPLL